MATAVIPVLKTIGIVLGTAFAGAAASDVIAGTNIITPRKGESRKALEIGRVRNEQRAEARSMAEGFHRYIKSLTDVAPVYVMRNRPALRGNYERAVRAKQRLIERDERRFQNRTDT